MGGEQGRMEGRKVGRLSESQITLIKGFHGTRIVGRGMISIASLIQSVDPRQRVGRPNPTNYGRRNPIPDN